MVVKGRTCTQFDLHNCTVLLRFDAGIGSDGSSITVPGRRTTDLAGRHRMDPFLQLDVVGSNESLFPIRENVNTQLSLAP